MSCSPRTKHISWSPLLSRPSTILTVTRQRSLLRELKLDAAEQPHTLNPTQTTRHHTQVARHEQRICSVRSVSGGPIKARQGSSTACADLLDEDLLLAYLSSMEVQVDQDARITGGMSALFSVVCSCGTSASSSSDLVVVHDVGSAHLRTTTVSRSQ